MKILIAGFDGKNNSTKNLLDCIKEINNIDTLYLKNSFKTSVKQIEEKMLQNYDEILLFGQRPNTKNIYLETSAFLENTRLVTDYDYASLKKILKEANYKVLISCNAGKYLCNNLFFRALEFKRKNKLKGNIAFIHISTMKNMENIKNIVNALQDYIKNI